MLFRFDPFEQLDRFEQKRSLLAMDAVRAEDRVYVYFDAPGVEPDGVEITLEKGSVTVQATRRWFGGDQRTLASERSQGVFTRQIQLGDSLDVDELEATLESGVLTLAIPVKESAKPRTIGVKHTPRMAEKQLTTTAS